MNMAADASLSKEQLDEQRENELRQRLVWCFSGKFTGNQSAGGDAPPQKAATDFCVDLPIETLPEIEII